MSTKRTIFSMIEEDLLEGVKKKLETGKFDVNTLDEVGQMLSPGIVLL